jgi:hypothetical protein
MKRCRASLTQLASINELSISLLWNYIDFNLKWVSMHLCLDIPLPSGSWSDIFFKKNVLAFLSTVGDNMHSPDHGSGFGFFSTLYSKSMAISQ